MPTLSREQEQAFLDGLEARTGRRELWCFFCAQRSEFRVSGGIYALQTYKVGSEGRLIDPEGPVMPVVAIICQNCGHTFFFNAVIAGTLFESLGMK